MKKCAGWNLAVVILFVGLFSCFFRSTVYAGVDEELQADVNLYSELAAKKDYLGMLGLLYKWSGVYDGPYREMVENAAEEIGIVSPGASFGDTLDAAKRVTFKELHDQVESVYASYLRRGDYLGASRYMRSVREYLDSHPGMKRDYVAAVYNHNHFGYLVGTVVKSFVSYSRNKASESVVKEAEQLYRNLTNEKKYEEAAKVAGDWTLALKDIRREDPDYYESISRRFRCGDALRFVEGLQYVNGMLADLSAAGRAEDKRKIISELEGWLKEQDNLGDDLSSWYLGEGKTLTDGLDVLTESRRETYIDEYRRDAALWTEYMRGGRYDLADALVDKWRGYLREDPELKGYLERKLGVDDFSAHLDTARSLADEASGSMYGEEGLKKKFLDDYEAYLSIHERMENAMARDDILVVLECSEKLMELMAYWEKWAEENPNMAELLGPLVGGDFSKMKEAFKREVQAMADYLTSYLGRHPEKSRFVWRSLDSYLSGQEGSALGRNFDPRYVGTLMEDVFENDHLVEDIHVAAYGDSAESESEVEAEAGGAEVDASVGDSGVEVEASTEGENVEVSAGEDGEEVEVQEERMDDSTGGFVSP